MNTRFRLSGDPYAGAREAHHALHQTATDLDWEEWLAASSNGANGEFDNFDALAGLCNECLSRINSLSGDQLVSISWSAGYFEAMRSVTGALIESLPTSGCAPHHFKRYQASLINPSSQFE